MAFDLEGTVRAWLATQAAITTLTGTRVYADVVLYGGWTPNVGPTLLLASRGASPLFPTSPTWSASIQFRSYALTLGAARELDGTLREVLLGERGGGPASGPITSASAETTGQPLRDPDVNAPYVLSYYRLTLTLQEA